MRLLLALSLAVLSMLPARAAEDCDNASDQRTLDECANQDARKADAELNALYKQIRERLKDDQDTTRLLVAAEKAWIAFRDAECTFAVSGSAQGSIYPMAVASCRAGLTYSRIEQLKDYLNCQEGDLECPVPAQ